MNTGLVENLIIGNISIRALRGKIRNGKDMCMDFRNSETPQKLIEALMMCEIIMHLHAMQRYVLRTVSLRNSFADCGSES